MALQRRTVDVAKYEKLLKNAPKTTQTLERKTYGADEYKQVVSRKLATAQAEVRVLTARTTELAT